MEEDWRYWRGQFSALVAEKLECEGIEWSLGKLEPNGGADQDGSGAKRFLEPPLVPPSHIQQRPRALKRCKVCVKVKFRRYRWPRPEWASYTKSPAGRKLMESPLVVGAHLRRAGETSNVYSADTTTSASAISPEFPCFDFESPLDAGCGLSESKCQLFERPIFVEDKRAAGSFLFLCRPAWQPSFPNYTRISPYDRPLDVPSVRLSGSLPQATHALCPAQGRLYPWRPNFKTNYLKPKFPLPPAHPLIVKELFLATGDDVMEEVGHGPLVIDHGIKAVDCIAAASPLRLKSVQVLVNRRMLSMTRIIASLEANCDELNLVERDFCESLPVLAISSDTFLCCVGERSADNAVAWEDIRRLSQSFKSAIVIVPSSVKHFTPAKRRLMNALSISMADCRTKYSDNVVLTIAELIRSRGPTLESLDPDLTAHERILFQIRGYNYWGAQRLLATPGFSLASALLPGDR